MARDPRKTVILLGAGASFGYVPVTAVLTQELLASIQIELATSSEATTVSQLVQELTRLKIGANSNFEVLMEALDILSDLEERQSDPNRWEMSAGRSVLSCLVDISGAIRKLPRTLTWSAVRSYVAQKLELLLRNCQRRGGERSHGCVALLGKLADCSSVFSLNYDHLIEKGTGRFGLVNHLHGCIPDTEETEKAHGCDTYFKTSPSNSDDRGWITGNSKVVDIVLSSRYQDCFFRIESSIRRASCVLIIGYGFGDRHINAVLARRPRNSQLCVVDFCDSPSAISELLSRITSSGVVWPPPSEIQDDLAHDGHQWRKVDRKKAVADTLASDRTKWHRVSADYWIFVGGIGLAASAPLPETH